MKRAILVFLSILILFIFPHSVTGQGVLISKTSVPDSIKIKRFAAMCKLWGTLKYFHPYLAYRPINWDSAFVAAAKDAGNAQSTNDYKNAIQTMLQALHDPTTRILNLSIQNTTAAAASSPRWQFTTDSILVVTIDRYSDLIDYTTTIERFHSIESEIPKSKGVLFDLRSFSPLSEDDRGNLEEDFNYSGFQHNLSRSPLKTPGQRERMHFGFSPQNPNIVGYSYTSAFYILDGKTISPDTLASEKPMVFLLNENSEIPSAALGLPSVNKGAIVIEGSPTERSFVNTQRFDAGEGVIVEFRLGELIYPDGSAGVDPVAVPPGEHQKDESYQAALNLLRKGEFHNTWKPHLPSCAQFIPDNPYKEMSYPPAELRLLAAAKIWVTINYFFPYKQLMNEDWSKTLEEFIPRLLTANDSLEYNLNISEMAARIHDSHGRIYSPTIDKYFGVARPPIYLKYVENRPVVISFLNDSIAKKSGIEIGDIIEEVDGEKADSRMKRYERYIPASTEMALHRTACMRLLNGADSSIATLTVLSKRNQRKTVKLLRSVSFPDPYEHWRGGDIIKLLPGNIGYADLDRMPVPMIDSMFDLFKNTKAIIFDMRGYPMGTAYQIASRLTEKSDVEAENFYRPTVMFPDGNNSGYSGQTQMYSFAVLLPVPSKPCYKELTVMLIDERAQSQAEEAGLFLRTANGTKFIGSPTAGANGMVTNLVVPGGITIRFTGIGIAHADGTQLQRVGLLPDVKVEPTIHGIQAGKDEVLEKAIEYIGKESSK